jgi:ElaB/YqjD/DUF883 family membrane-anchored ribosome-binding protein
MSSAINFIKDKLIWAADWVEDHPWWSLTIMGALGVLVLVA